MKTCYFSRWFEHANMNNKHFFASKNVNFFSCKRILQNTKNSFSLSKSTCDLILTQPRTKNNDCYQLKYLISSICNNEWPKANSTFLFIRLHAHFWVKCYKLTPCNVRKCHRKMQICIWWAFWKALTSSTHSITINILLIYRSSQYNVRKKQGINQMKSFDSN